MSSSTEPLLVVSGLQVAYRDQIAVRDVSLQAGAGECVAVVGANGAGKSTTVRAISGLVKARSGTVRINGSATNGKPADRIARMGIAVVPEGRALFTRLSLYDNLMLGGYSRSDAGEADVHELIELVAPELRDRLHDRAGVLSGGQQQMLAIARALMLRPRLLVLDEPTLGLAPTVVKRVASVLKTLRDEQSLGVLLFDQRRTLAEQIDARGYVMRSGLIASDVTAGAWNDPEVARHYLSGLP
jgi:ABC-type branched-subunit amino acid transport system ATPase component